MDLPSKYSPNWDEFWECEYDILKFVVLTSHVVHSTLKCSQNSDKFCLKENIYLEFTITPSNIASWLQQVPKIGVDFARVCNLKLTSWNLSILYCMIRVVFSCWAWTLWGYVLWICRQKKLDPNHPRRWDRFTHGGYCEYKHFGSFMLCSERYTKYLTCKRRWKRCTFKIKMMAYSQQCYYFLLCFVSGILFEFNHPKHRFNCDFMNRYNDLTYWVHTCLSYAILLSYSCIFLLQLYLHRKIVKIDNNKKKAIIYPNKKDLDDNSKCYFRAGGRHQTVINGESVYEYLQLVQMRRYCTTNYILKDFFFWIYRIRTIECNFKEHIRSNCSYLYFKNSTRSTIKLLKHEGATRCQYPT
jgi:hypothetical protein